MLPQATDLLAVGSDTVHSRTVHPESTGVRVACSFLVSHEMLTDVEYQQLMTNTYPDEVWALIPGWDGVYSVSTHGRVRRDKAPRIGVLKFDDDRRGYSRVTLSRAGQARQFRVHHLVLLAFVCPQPSGCVCRHLDGNRRNNLVSNLRWGSRVQNEADKVRHGTTNRGARNGGAKLTAAGVRAAKVLRDAGWTYVDIADALGVESTAISRICSGTRWASTT